MRIHPLIVLVLGCLFSFGTPAHGKENPKKPKPKRDSVLAQRPIRNRYSPATGKQGISAALIEKMSDQQLMLLVDHMFEASYMPPDLWNEVLLETAKRNLCRRNRNEFEANLSGSRKPGSLRIEKLVPAPDETEADSETMAHPASGFYKEWDDDFSKLFKDEFTPDATYTLELENSEYGCFRMPSWGPLSSPFGWRHNRYHKGIDIQMRKGDTIRCAFDGMVRFAQKKGGYGNVVIVRHYNGLETVYAHLSKIKVKEGDVLGAGDLVGLAGSTGHSTGPHLHFEIRFMGAPVDPLYFISFDYGSLLYNTVEFRKNKNGLLAAFHPRTEFHTVDRGETFAEIAMHYGVSTQTLRAMNGMKPKQYVRLRKGMVLRVRTVDHGESASR